MMEKLRVTVSVSLDNKKEADIIENLKDMSSRHELGTFVTGVIKYVFDNEKRANAMKEAVFNNSYKLTSNRDNFFNALEERVNSFDKKLNDLYNMNMKLLSSYEAGNRLGMSDMIDNIILSNFIVERQLNELKSIVGMSSNDLDRNKLKRSKEFANDVVEDVITHYAKEFEALKRMGETISVRQVIKEEPLEIKKEHKEIKKEHKEVKKEHKEVKREQLVDDNLDGFDLLGGSSGDSMDLSALDAFCGG